MLMLMRDARFALNLTYLQGGYYCKNIRTHAMTPSLYEPFISAVGICVTFLVLRDHKIHWKLYKSSSPITPLSNATYESFDQSINILINDQDLLLWTKISIDASLIAQKPYSSWQINLVGMLTRYATLPKLCRYHHRDHLDKLSSVI